MKGSLGRHCDLELLGQSISSSLVLTGITKQNGYDKLCQDQLVFAK